MNAPHDTSATAAIRSAAPGGITILYEDRAAGLRAKRFSDMLSAALGDGPHTEPACWRLDLVDFPDFARKISRDAAASEFLLLSLRGDRTLSGTTRCWLESSLAGAVPDITNVIALFDPVRGVASHVESTRSYLRQVTALAGVTFFAHCITTPADCDARWADEPEEPLPLPRPRRRRRHPASEHFPTTVPGSLQTAAVVV